MPKRLPFAIAAPLAGLLLMAAVSPGLDGSWSGDSHVLRFSATAVTLETGCASATFGPAIADKDGHFRVEGRYTAHTAGPQSVMEEGPGAGGQPATLAGRLQGDRLDLELGVKGLAPQRLRLERGNRVKLIRCYGRAVPV